MTEHERNQTPEPRPDAKEQDSASPSRGMSRRRFGQAALGSVPVLMTLYTNPLRASNGTPGNCHPSGWVSGNTSRNGEAQPCGSRSPGWWGEPNGQGVDIARSYDFNEEFDLTRRYVDGDGKSITFAHAAGGHGQWWVYEEGGGRVRNQERRVIRFGAATYLNRTQGEYDSDRPTLEEIKKMVEGILNDDKYVIPGTGDELGAKEVADFLENTTGSNFAYPG